MTDLPKRIQLQRTKRWRMPPDTVKVDRSTKWGNPFKVGARNPYGTITQNRRHAFMLYVGFAPLNETLVKAAQAELRGKNLACWCEIDPYQGTCHADILLKIANPPEAT